MAETGHARLKIVFMGTPDFAAEILKKLTAWDGGEVIAAYTQPDRPCGRGLECRPSAVKTLAMEHDIDVYQPENFKEQAAIDELAALEPDVLVVAAYGLILPQAVLDVPKLMPVNVHASLLPKYRGAAPIQRAVQNGEHTTGITIMRMEAGLDSGPILLQRALGIGMDESAGDLHDQLADLGGTFLVEALMRLQGGELLQIEQDHDRATYAPKLSKKEGLVDFAKTAQEVHNHIRAMHPWPGAYFFWTNEAGKKMRIGLKPGRIGDKPEGDPAPGTILGCDGDELAVACADKVYLFPAVKPEGKKEMDGRAFECGYLGRECTPDEV